MYKGGKFLKKLWCCVGGEYYKIIWFCQLSCNVNWPPYLESRYGGQFTLSTQLIKPNYLKYVAK